MNRTSLISIVALGLLSLPACQKDDPAKERREARKEMGEALDEHREKVNEALDKDQPEKIEEVSEANRELAEKHKKAYEDVEEAEAEKNEQMARARPESELDPVNDRFEAYKDETKDQFKMRASARINALEQEIKSIEGTVSEDATDEIADARSSLEEARKDLGEVVGGTEEVFDDGKAGVAVAINRARRKVERIKDETADKK